MAVLSSPWFTTPICLVSIVSSTCSTNSHTSCRKSRTIHREGSIEFSLVTPSAVSVIPDPTEPLDDTWEGSIHELFAKQAERVPDFPAVIDPDNRWSYGELDRRSNQLANYLIAQGIKPKDVVAIYAQRSAALVVALLGILKAGAAFVILDPAYPARRLISYLRIAQAAGMAAYRGCRGDGRGIKGVPDDA